MKRSDSNLLSSNLFWFFSVKWENRKSQDGSNGFLRSKPEVAMWEERISSQTGNSKVGGKNFLSLCYFRSLLFHRKNADLEQNRKSQHGRKEFLSILWYKMYILEFENFAQFLYFCRIYWIFNVFSGMSLHDFSSYKKPSKKTTSWFLNFDPFLYSFCFLIS